MHVKAVSNGGCTTVTDQIGYLLASRAERNRMPRQPLLSIQLALVLLFVSCIASAQTGTPPIEEVLVTGEHPGPGMWRVLHGDHTLWILGTHAPLPARLVWRSEEVEIAISEAQQVLGSYSASFSLRGSNPLAMQGKPLRRILPRRTYSQWRTLKQKYLGDSDEVERALPVTAALVLRSSALQQSGLANADVVIKEIYRLARAYQVPVTTHHQVTKVLENIPTDSNAQRRGVAFLTQTLANLESDVRTARTRANAWATGDIEALRAQAAADERAADLYANSWPYLDAEDLAALTRETDARWLSAAEQALRRNHTTVATLPIFMLLQSDGLLARLREKGFEVIEPTH